MIHEWRICLHISVGILVCGYLLFIAVTNPPALVTHSIYQLSAKYEKYGNITLPSSTNGQAIGKFTQQYWMDNSLLPRRVTLEEHDAMIELLRAVDGAFRENNVTFLMSGGTLIGSYFHHDLVPWDDDLDLLAPLNQTKQIIEAFKSLQHKYKFVHMFGNLYLKLYPIHGKDIGKSYKWPYVDVFLYRTNRSHWWEIDMPDVFIKIDDVFPLVRRPFGPLWLPAPRNTLLNIVRTERMNTAERTCTSNQFDHKGEEWITSKTVPCEKLMGSYPFVVDRRPGKQPGQLIEELRVGNQTVQEVMILQ